MSDIQSFIKMASQQLGASESQTKDATGAVLGFLKDKVDDGDFSSMLSALPGASNLLSGGGGGGGGGLMGGLSKLAGSALGDKFGGAAGLIGALSSSGLESGKIDDFVGLFAGFLKSNLDGDLLGKILGQVPELKKLVG